MKLQETADPNTTIEVRDPSGAVIGTGTSDANGDFTVNATNGNDQSWGYVNSDWKG